MDGEPVDSQVCASCKEFMREKVEVGCQQLWNEIPAIFELPPWGELILATAEEQRFEDEVLQMKRDVDTVG